VVNQITRTRWMRTRNIVFLAIVLLLASTAAQAQDILEAAKQGDLARVKELVNGVPQLENTSDENGRTPLHWAARGVHVEILAYLIDKGANVDAQDINLVTPLHSVCSRGHVEGARILIDANADVSSAMFDLSTPLHLAVTSGNAELVSLLLDNGAPPQVRDSRDDTPLHTAAHTGKWDVVDAMAVHLSGSDPEALNSVDFDGNTVLHLACQSGRMQTVKTIVPGTTGVNIRNTVGQSAYNVAIERGFTEIADYLAQHRADTGPQRFPKLTGPYLSQEPPDTIPLLFAKGIVSTRIGMYGTIVFSPDGKEAFWKPELPKLMFIRTKGGFWSAPRVFAYEGKINVPFISIDGQRLYVMIKPQDKEEIWYFTRSGEHWSGPDPIDSAINSNPMHWQFSIDRAGDVYFSSSGIVCARRVDGEYTPPELLPPPINTVDESQEQYREGLVGPCISPDGGCLIYTKFTADRRYPVQLYISFRSDNGSWSEPQNLSQNLQTEGNDSAPMLSPDGKYLFFQSVRKGSGASRGLYWVSADVIDEMRPKP